MSSGEHSDLEEWKEGSVSLCLCNLLHGVSFAHKRQYSYSRTPLLWTHWGPGKVSCIERCPHFRGKFIAYFGHSKSSLLQRCQGVLISGVSLFQGFHCTVVLVWLQVIRFSFCKKAI